MNELQWVTDCIFWLLNLLIPALTWALVIAGLTWIIKGTGSRDVSRHSEDHLQSEGGLLCTGQNRLDKAPQNPGCILCEPCLAEYDGQPRNVGGRGENKLAQ